MVRKKIRVWSTGAVLIAIVLCWSAPLPAQEQKLAPIEFMSFKESLAHRIGTVRQIHVANPPWQFTGVQLEVIVDPSGAVKSAKAKYGPEEYYAQAEAIEMQREYKPFEKNGLAVRALIVDRVEVLPFEQWAARKMPFPEIKDWNSLRITLERRNGGLDSTPSYSVEIRGDGSVAYDGTYIVVISGVHHEKISHTAVVNLINQFRAVGYFSLKDRYAAAISGCPTYKTSLEIDGVKKEVTDYFGGHDGMPESVQALEDGIDEATMTEKWVKETDQTWASLLAEKWDFKAHTDENRSLFANVVAMGSVELAHKFLLAGAPALELTKNGQAALLSASAGGSEYLVAQMTAGQEHIDPRLLDRALYLAARSGNLETVDLLLRKGAEVNGGSGDDDYPQGVLMASVASGKADVVREILRYHPDVRRKDGVATMFFLCS